MHPFLFPTDLHTLLYSSPLTVWTVLLRLILVTLCSGTIGFERGYRGRAAGLRTHILVGMGAAATVLTGVYAVDNLGYTEADPLRIAAQVVSGIGFLGAGTILVRGKTTVTGLTTAAGLWMTAAIGIAIGIGFYSVGLVCTPIAMIAFGLLTKFERSGKYARSSMKIYVESTDVYRINSLIETLTDDEHGLREIEITPARSGLTNHIGIEATVLLKKKADKKEKLRKIAEVDTVLCAIESV